MDTHFLPAPSSASPQPPRYWRRAATAVAIPMALGLALSACSTSGTSAEGSGADVIDGVVTLNAEACPASATEALADGADIVIGTSLAMSGPGASSAVSLGGINAYFDKVNAEGGIDGHKITLNAKDDALDPARAVANVKTLIEQDKVFATILQLGTPQTQGTRPMYEKNCVPQLYVSSGAPDFYDPSSHQWSTSSFLPYDAWGEATAAYLDQEFPGGAKVGELVWNSDTGQASSIAFKDAIEGSKVEVVAQPSHDSTAVSMSNQVDEILAKSPEVIVGSTGGAFCNQLVSSARRAGFDGPIILPLSCRDTTQFFEPLGDLATGVLTVRSSLDPADATVADDASVKAYLADMAKYQPSYNAQSTYVADGYRFAALLVEQLKRAGGSEGGLSRVGLMDAVWSTDTDLPLNFEGKNVVINSDQPFPVGNGAMLSYDFAAKGWNTTGIEVEASKP